MTTVERRLAKVEAGLSPMALVLRWLAEAHAYDDLTDYTRSLLAAEPPVAPLDRLVQEAETNARRQGRGQPRDQLETTVRKALVETIFRYQLVLRINALSQEAIDKEILVHGALTAHVGLAIADGKADTEGPPLARLVKLRDLLFGRVDELHAIDAAREAVEARYLDGVSALFPAGQRSWSTQQTASERMAVMAMRLAEFDGAEPPPDDDLVAFEARVAQLVADHVEPARSNAYDQLGDGRRALGLAVRWLRPKLGLAPMSW